MKLILNLAAVDCDVKQLQDIAEDLFNELQKFAGALEEGTRNVLSECLGRTVIAKPELCDYLQVFKIIMENQGILLVLVP